MVYRVLSETTAWVILLLFGKLWCEAVLSLTIDIILGSTALSGVREGNYST